MERYIDTLECPFCGSSSTFEHGISSEKHISCFDCGCGTGECGSIQVALQRWTARTNETRLRESRDALLAILEKAIKQDGGISGGGDPESHDLRACCGVRDFEQHKYNCWVFEAQQLLEELEE